MDSGIESIIINMQSWRESDDDNDDGDDDDDHHPQVVAECHLPLRLPKHPFIPDNYRHPLNPIPQQQPACFSILFLSTTTQQAQAHLFPPKCVTS